ncbi:MAG TPA: twin-arginine translocase TatA/TatE family subunit [Anaerolineales bacterium]|nr:twin-arginine translocase TatA/TatE family subunit [Anaerolineales bacterium]
MEIGMPELGIILVIVLLIFGPGRILKVSRELGAGIRQFKEGLEGPFESNQPEKNSDLSGNQGEEKDDSAG